MLSHASSVDTCAGPQPGHTTSSRPVRPPVQLPYPGIGGWDAVPVLHRACHIPPYCTRHCAVACAPSCLPFSLLQDHASPGPTGLGGGGLFVAMKGAHDVVAHDLLLGSCCWLHPGLPQGSAHQATAFASRSGGPPLLWCASVGGCGKDDAKTGRWGAVPWAAPPCSFVTERPFEWPLLSLRSVSCAADVCWGSAIAQRPHLGGLCVKHCRRRRGRDAVWLKQHPCAGGQVLHSHVPNIRFPTVCGHAM